MKKAFILLLLIVIFGFISGNYYKAGLHGMIEPVDGARKVWAGAGKPVDRCWTDHVEGIRKIENRSAKTENKRLFTFDFRASIFDLVLEGF